MNDEIMIEVHAIKDAIGDTYGSDLVLLYKEINRGEAKLRQAGVNVLLRPINPKSVPISVR